MNAKLLQLLETSTDMLQRALDSANAEIPLVIQQYLDWQFWNCIFNIVCSIAVLVLSWFAHKGIQYKIRQSRKENNYITSEIEVLMIVGYTCIAFIALLATILGIECIREAIQICVAPKVYLIESIKTFIK